MNSLKLFVLPLAFLVANAPAFGQCPLLAVFGPKGVTQIGDPMTFKVEAPGSDLKYLWKVSTGVITAGQGTQTITILTNGPMAGSNVTATVDVDGLPSDCNRSASGSAPVAAMIEGLIMDEWEGLKPNDVRGRLDAFFSELKHNPLNVGVVVLQLTDKERFDSTNKRIKFVVKHVKFREFDLNRIWFVLERVGYSRTKVYRVPPGAELMRCYSTCITIKGGDL